MLSVTGLCGVLVSLLGGVRISNGIFKPILELPPCPNTAVHTVGDGWSPVLGSRLHQPRFYLKNRQGAVPWAVCCWSQACFTLQQRWDSSPQHEGSAMGTFVRAGVVTRRIEEVSVSLSPVRRFVA